MHLNEEVNFKVDNSYKAYTVAFPQMSPNKHKKNKLKKRNDDDLFFMRESLTQLKIKQHARDKKKLKKILLKDQDNYYSPFIRHLIAEEPTTARQKKKSVKRSKKLSVQEANNVT